MHALLSTILPPSAVHHSLFLPNLTPSTIYPLPRPHGNVPEVKVVGNLIVAGSDDIRVFEIRESLGLVEESPQPNGVNGHHGANGDADVKMEDGRKGMEGMDEDFYDTGHSEVRMHALPGTKLCDPHMNIKLTFQRAPVRYETKRKLHLLTRHQLHGIVTGLAGLRTIESSVDGLDRLLVSFKDAKMAILEWSQGDLSTVSLHTYERCQQMMTGDLQVYHPRLRTDPLSRLAILTLPEDSLAILPLLQELSDLDMQEGVSRDVPYSPSFVLSLPDIAPNLRNLADLAFLSGFHSPTLALLYSPVFTWAGRYKSVRDNFVLEIRTFDLSSGGSYPLLTSVPGLPSDSLYIVACPAELGGVVVVTETGIIHVDQSGRVLGTSVNGWWSYATAVKSDGTSEGRKLSLEGSKAIFVDSRDMLLILQNGDVHQVRFEMDGRSIGAIKVDEQSSSVPPPSSLVVAGDKALFIGCAEGDSLLAKVDMIRETIQEEKKEEMEVDWDEDLYGDINASTNGHTTTVATGPAYAKVSEYDTLAGVGKIMDMQFGIAVSDTAVRSYPQLVTIGGGKNKSTFNVFRRGIPITKRRRYNEIQNADAVWFLPIQRQTGQKLKDVPEAERTTMLFSSEKGATRIFALTTRATPEQIGRIGSITLNVAPFFGRSGVVHVSPNEALLLDSDGKKQSSIFTIGEVPIVSAAISDPFVALRLADGTVKLFSGDITARTVAEVESDLPLCHSIEVFTDTSGIYRAFEASRPEASGTARTTAIRAGQQARGQLTQEQIQRLQDEKPAISTEAQETLENAMDPSRGTQWLAALASTGELQIRSLPDLGLVLQSKGLLSSDPSFTDDAGAGAEVDEEQDQVRQLLFAPIGRENPRPHLLALHASGRLNIYEAQPRFTLDANTQSRRSLAIRFRKVYTMLLPLSSSSRLQYNMIPFANIEGLTGVFITGDRPQWVMSSDAHVVKSYGLKQAAFAFGKTTHLGGTGEYFIRIEDGSFICYLPPSLNTDFAMPCDRYPMNRVYTNLAFDPPSGHYVGAAAITVPFQAYDEEGEIQIGPAGETLIPPTNERSTLELFSQGNDPWRVIGGYDFDQGEQVLTMQSVTLESPSTPSGFRDFIAVGTGFDLAEDRATRGNLYVFEVCETVKAPGELGGWKLKIRYKDPARNPVSAVSTINGYLLNSNGPKIYVKGLDNDDQLMGLAFLDVSIYVTSIRVFKNFLLISDVMRSIWFVSLQENPYKFTVIGKDLQQVSVMTGDFLAHDGSVTFVTTDRNGIMRMVDYDPTDPDSLNGERLILRTEYGLGVPTTQSRVIARRKTVEEESAPQTQIIYATADGALTTLVSVKEARFKRLQLVSDQLVRNAQHVAGLNPRSIRVVRNELGKPLSKGILDGNLLEHFALQPVARQREMMRQIGTDEVTVASDLVALSGFW